VSDSSLFYGGGANGSLFYGSGSGGGTGTGDATGGVNLEAIERTGRRASLLSSFANDLSLSAPDASLALAESPMSDDEMLRSATESVDYANIQHIMSSLQAEKPGVQHAMYRSLPKPIADALRKSGYKPPPDAKRKGGSRWGVNLPDFLPGPNELTLPDSTPILGPVVGGLQHATGETLEAGRDVAGKALQPFQWAGEQIPHLYRAMKYSEEQKNLSWAQSFNPGNYFSPSQLAKSWHATDPDDGYVRPAAAARARKILGGDPQLYDIAHGMATGKTSEQIIQDAGFELDSPEALQMSLAILEAQSKPELKDAVHQLSVGQVSFGRTITQDALGMDDTDSGLGRLLSGTIDAGFDIAADPTIGIGHGLKAARFGRYAYMLETAGDVERMGRAAKLASNLERAREGATAIFRLGDVRPSELRNATNILRWSDRVADAFKTGKLAELGRELPNTMPVLSSLSDAHVTRGLNGLAGLDKARGVLGWLQSRDGLLELAASRLGGSSPMVEGLRMPSLSRAEQVAVEGKKVWTKAIDWSRLQYTFGPDAVTWAQKMSEFTSAANNPAALTRQVGQFMLSQTVGNTGRLVAGLTAHAPYSQALRLYGNESVEEFSRMVNLGLFGRMARPEMDAYIDAFTKGDLVVRANMQERFLEQLFRKAGIADTKFAERFVGRARQAYAIDQSDLVDIGDVRSHAAKLVDVHHADALAIPNWRQFFQETARANTTRFLFNNTPASWMDAAIGKAWKPSVLMRIGFIPRAGGEEMLHYILKVGSRRYLGAKGAEWVAADELGNQLQAQIATAEALGHTDEVNRLTQRYAQTQGFFSAPLRQLAGAGDRLFTHLFESNAVDLGPFRTRITNKAHALDERGVVSGLENFAIEKSLWSSGLMEKMASATHMPSKAQIGQWMAERWNPSAIEAARILASDPRAQRAFVEQVAGSTFTPWEFVGQVDGNGAPIPKVLWTDRTGGHPVVREIPMKPRPGEYATQSLLDSGGDVTSFFHSVFSRQMRLKKDRVANAVLNDTLPRWVGDFGGDLASRLGHAEPSTLRDHLNQLWAWEGDGDRTGPALLRGARKLISDPGNEGLRTWLGQGIDQAAGELGLNLDGRKLSRLFESTDLDNAPKHWLAYEKVDPDRLIDDFADLEKQLGHRSKGRLSRPDMQRKLQEMRLYSDDRLAVPTRQGVRKVYVPMVEQLPDALTEDFISAATRNIRYIGGYGEERARQIAQNVADSVGAAHEIKDAARGLTPLSGWGAADPRVSDAVMAAADQVLGTTSTHGILEVPEDVIQRSAGDRAQGLRTLAGNWKTADDYMVDPWRLMKTQATDQNRRLVQLQVGGEWWDDVDLQAATSAFKADPVPGRMRLYRGDTGPWTTLVPNEPFRFVDVDPSIAARYKNQLPDDLADELGAKRLPGKPPDDGRWLITDRQMSPGLGEIEAMERVANASMDEVKDVLTTANRQELNPDVLHEVVEPMLRPDHVKIDEAGNKIIEQGYGFDHLIGGVDWKRLPQETYGPVMAAAPDFRWDKIVSNWFEGPVDHAISSMIRKPMFLDNFGRQLRNQKALADLFVDPDIWEAVRASGLDDAALDSVAMALPDGATAEQIADLLGEAGLEGVGENEIKAFRRFAEQRTHGIDTIRQNAMQRSIQLTTPFIDDHRIRSAFQNYVGNFVPFQFAEEQFLKRWARSVVESPEMIRRAQLGMNGIRSMGVVRKDEQGKDMFVYPLAGEAMAAISSGVASMFGEKLRVPYSTAMTGEVGYTLPGLGQRFGVPSVGPLVSMSLELLSRHFPELADLEQQVSGPGADRPVWTYFTPTWAAKTWSAVFGDLDKGQLASATNQAIQTLALNGDMPPEDATPDQQQEFIERAQGIARTIIMARGLFGMVTPSAPNVRTKADDLNAEYVKLLRISPSPDEATQAFIKMHPDIEPADLLAATVFTSESKYAGLPTPTDETFNWVKNNPDIVGGFPAAAPWLLPRAGAEDKFSYRAWSQQVAKGLRVRKSSKDLIDDIRFAGAARDYFEAKTQHDSDMLLAQGATRSQLTEEWNTWKAGYYRQHPVFANMLEDPTRQQHRAQAMQQLEVLASDPHGPVPAELSDMVAKYRKYQYSIAGLRGARSQGASATREQLTTDLVTWVEWQVQKHPWLAGFYLRVIKPDLQGLDADAVVSTAA